MKKIRGFSHALLVVMASTPVAPQTTPFLMTGRGMRARETGNEVGGELPTSPYQPMQSVGRLSVAVMSTTSST